MSIEQADTTGTATWRDPAWRDAALGWAFERLTEQGLEVDGLPEQEHVRAWSTAIRIPVAGVSRGAVWLKSVGSGSAQEPVLAAAVGRWAPTRVLVPLAVHADERLLLLPDGGRTLRSVGGARMVEAWESMLASYARLQIELVPHASEMVDLGVPDNRPDRLPGLIAGLLEDRDALMLGRPEGMAPAVRDRLLAGLDRYGQLCAVLADGPVPETLQHDDLHDDNVFVAGNGHRFFDWGDASVSHPFLSLTVPLRMATSALDLPPGHPVLLRLRDAYLQPWRSFAEPAVLRELCDVALAVTPLQRALTWHRILLGVHRDERAEWQASVPGWAAEHLEAGPLAGVPGG